MHALDYLTISFSGGVIKQQLPWPYCESFGDDDRWSNDLYNIARTYVSSKTKPINMMVNLNTLGEFEYNDTFKDDDGSQKVPANAYIRIIRLIFFLAFLISIPVAYFNLLTGFALDKVMVRCKQ